MRMTREEAIDLLRDTPIDIRSTREDDIHTLYATAQMMAIDALRTLTREQVEKVWRGEWIECQTAFGEKYNKCSRCGFTPSFGYPAFCASCGSANTGEAVEMVMKRLNKMEEMKK